MGVFLKTVIFAALVLGVIGVGGAGVANTPPATGQGNREKHLKIVETLNVSSIFWAVKGRMYTIKRMLGLPFNPVWYYNQSGGDAFFQRRVHMDLASIETMDLVFQEGISSTAVEMMKARKPLFNCNLRIGFGNVLIPSEIIGSYPFAREVQGRFILRVQLGDIVRRYYEQGKSTVVLEEIVFHLPGQDINQIISNPPLEAVVFQEWDKDEKMMWLEAERVEKSRLDMERTREKEAQMKLDIEREKVRKEAEAKLEMERKNAERVKLDSARKEAQIKAEVREWVKRVHIRNQPWKKAISNYLGFAPLILMFVAFHWGWRHGLWLPFGRWLQSRGIFPSFPGNTLVSRLGLYRSILPLTILIDWSLWIIVLGLGFWTFGWVELFPVLLCCLVFGEWVTARWLRVLNDLGNAIVNKFGASGLNSRHHNLWLGVTAGLFMVGLLTVGNQAKNYYLVCGGVVGGFAWHTFIRSNLGVKWSDLEARIFSGHGVFYIAGFVSAFILTLMAFVANWGRLAEQFAVIGYYLLILGTAHQLGVLKRWVPHSNG